MKDGEKKKIFLIAVTDKEGTLNRMFQETMLELLNQRGKFCEEYNIEPHNHVVAQNLYASIDESLRAGIYEGYIIILDCLDIEKGLCNPNVMFEFGAIKYLGKPFVVMAAHPDEEYPFDVNDINIEPIPRNITAHIKKSYRNRDKINIIEMLEKDFDEEQKNITDMFLTKLYVKYKASFDEKIAAQKSVKNEDLLKEILQLKKLLNNTAEYIEGEGEAFTKLKESIDKANKSLRTTRFANQSIVGKNASDEQSKFMESLYKISNKLDDNFERIICNNHPAKWIDIFNILYYGKNGTKVYIRKENFSIHFELVIIDEEVAFIHFYQKDYSKLIDEKDIKEKEINVEKINSTLRIQGMSICKKLANIFDRLHHRDYESIKPKDPSRTLLGIPAQDIIDNKDINNGCFVLSKDAPRRTEYGEYGENKERKKLIINMFKNAFRTWKFDNETLINKDKINMVVGIALIEDDIEFIKEMQNQRLTDEEFSEAIKKYNEMINLS